MKNIVGQLATKDDFYNRKKEVSRILRNLEAGANLQIAAPRRAGKSSILYHLKDYPPKGFICLYVEVESARSTNDYYKKIYREIFKSKIINAREKVWAQLKQNKGGFFASLKGIKIIGIGIELNDANEINYEEELIDLLSGLDLGNQRLVLLIDEFSEVILNIAEESDTIKARKFLQSNRELRNLPEIREKVQFVYTGSNSLNITTGNMEASILINDLTSVPIEPLRAEDAADFIRQILLTYNYSILPEQSKYALLKIECNIPFYIQLLIQEIMGIIAPGDQITNNTIDDSFSKITEPRNDHYFEQYIQRLKRVITNSQLKFVHLFLKKLAKVDFISKLEIQNMTYGLLSKAEEGRILDILKDVGYIVNIDLDKYKFSSPLLKQWWTKHEYY